MGIKQPVIHAVFQNIENNMEKFMGSNDAIEISQKVGVSRGNAYDICIATPQQANCTSWYLQKSIRITASIFGKVINRRKTLLLTTSVKLILEKSMNKGRNTPAPLKWGLENESMAKYLKQKCLLPTAIESCDLVVNPKYQWLGCGPDGIVVENGSPAGCIEVKCPCSKRDCLVREAAMTDKRFFMKMVEGQCQLKAGHLYYYQCQRLLNILAVFWVDFAIYSNKDIWLERIFRDQTLWTSKMLPELKKVLMTSWWQFFKLFTATVYFNLLKICNEWGHKVC